MAPKIQMSHRCCSRILAEDREDTIEGIVLDCRPKSRDNLGFIK